MNNQRPLTTQLISNGNHISKSPSNLGRPGTTLRKTRRTDIARNEAIELAQSCVSFNNALMLATKTKFERKAIKHVTSITNSNKLPSCGPIRPLTVTGKIVPKIRGKDR